MNNDKEKRLKLYGKYYTQENITLVYKVRKEEGVEIYIKLKLDVRYYS